jgi:hypothetical protein
VCFRKGRPDILAERRRQAQCCEDESTHHFISLTDRGKSRTGRAAKTTPSGGTGPFFLLGWKGTTITRSFEAGGCEPASVRCLGDSHGCSASAQFAMESVLNFQPDCAYRKPIQPFSAQRNIVTLSWDPEENGRNNNSPATSLCLAKLKRHLESIA